MKYFLAFDYFNADINKFFWGIVSVDLTTENLNDFAKSMIREKAPAVDPESVTIKITAFNNITLE